MAKRTINLDKLEDAPLPLLEEALTAVAVRLRHLSYLVQEKIADSEPLQKEYEIYKKRYMILAKIVLDANALPPHVKWLEDR